MHRFRLSSAAWLLLKRLHDETAELALCTDPDCYRFHIVTGTQRGEIVRNLTMEALVASGFLQRSRTSTPCYKVSGKGKLALLNRGLKQFCQNEFDGSTDHAAHEQPHAQQHTGAGELSPA